MRAVRDAERWVRRPAWRLGGWRAWREAVGVVAGVGLGLWLLVARSDPPNARELVLRRYPRDPPVWGPYQAELRVEQDPSIAEQLGLWQRAGLLVLRGNVLTLPVGPTPLHVETVYLQRGVRQAVPEPWRVIVAAEGRVAMAPTLAEAVAQLTTDPVPP